MSDHPGEGESQAWKLQLRRMEAFSDQLSNSRRKEEKQKEGGLEAGDGGRDMALEVNGGGDVALEASCVGTLETYSTGTLETWSTGTREASGGEGLDFDRSKRALCGEPMSRPLPGQWTGRTHE
ncbi:hypothetical protein ILYODFUR_022439 [Ilyodon furcidens]|uniref:Uncharacterized protein n=1 Tax=Ilyodon furcidens TaxID=33524 RepID=A0ABV0V6W3_9TELE